MGGRGCQDFNKKTQPKLGFDERLGGIEPPASAWKAEVLPLYDGRILFTFGLYFILSAHFCQGFLKNLFFIGVFGILSRVFIGIFCVGFFGNGDFFGFLSFGAFAAFFLDNFASGDAADEFLELRIFEGF